MIAMAAFDGAVATGDIPGMDPSMAVMSRIQCKKGSLPWPMVIPPIATLVSSVMRSSPVGAVSGSRSS